MAASWWYERWVGTGSREVQSEVQADAKLAAIAKYGVAAVWVLGGLSVALGLNGESRLSGLLVVPFGIAYLRWPAALRWPMIIGAALAPAAFAGLAYWYFHTPPMYELVLWCLLAIVAQWLLMFGKMTRVRMALGGALLLAALVVGFPDPRTSAAMPADVCSQRVDALSRKLKPYALEPSPEFELHAAKLPKLARGERAPWPSGVIEVSPSGKWFQQRLADDTARAADELRQRIERVYPADGRAPMMYLAADAKQNVREIALLVSTLPKLHLLLLARAEPGPTGPPPPGARDLAQQLEQAQNTGEAASILAKQLGRRAGPCRLLSKRMAALEPPDRTATRDARPWHR